MNSLVVDFQAGKILFSGTHEQALAWNAEHAAPEQRVVHAELPSEPESDYPNLAQLRQAQQTLDTIIWPFIEYLTTQDLHLTRVNSMQPSGFLNPMLAAHYLDFCGVDSAAATQEGAARLASHRSDDSLSVEKVTLDLETGNTTHIKTLQGKR